MHSFGAVVAGASMPYDIFHDDDRIVDHKADRRRQPPSVIMLKLSPSRCITTSVIAIVTGMTRPATKALPQSRRNRISTSDASPIPMRMASRTLLMEALTASD